MLTPNYSEKQNTSKFAVYEPMLCFQTGYFIITTFTVFSTGKYKDFITAPLLSS